ncbi:MAG: Asp-tRNA(Asn)/Glu-tRNA(Gln) amidotransferase subunit GatC [Bacillota bacterium]|nr:Asp-tRNA(Asn)/Glu-tRNA(Gln) amidotransferase subunit GatC [Bacillota bacterium]
MSENKIITAADVEYVAKLANLRFDEAEKAETAVKLGAILEYMQQLNAIDVTGVAATTHVLELTNVFREDAVGESLSNSSALANAPDKDGAYFKVPKII